MSSTASRNSSAVFSTTARFALGAMLAVSALSACSSKNGGDGSVTPAPVLDLGALPDFASAKTIGGAGTSADPAPTSFSYSYAIPTLTAQELALHQEGDTNFERKFSDDSARPEYGLGPVYNNVSCIGCHNRDGRGSLPVGLSDNQWMKLGSTEAIFLRISIENETTAAAGKTRDNDFGAPVAVPGFSTQLFQLGTYKLREGSPNVGQAELHAKIERSTFTYADGSTVELQKPVFKIENPYDLTADANGTAHSRLFESDVRTSPRMGMPMYGLGLLEAITDADILAGAQVDHSSEGVHGKPNYVFDAVKARAGNAWPVSIGRFGLKASTPTVEQQSLAALRGDMGVTNPLFPNESIFGTPLYDDYVTRTGFKAKLEADQATADSIVFYSRTLAVPSRRGVDDVDVLKGARLFQQARCTSCHTPSFTTGPSDVEALAKQKIYPFTDLLLHDMGDGLADGRRDFDANGRDWKTRPLWGIGLTQIVNPRAGFLHDGRARTLDEAILWHDGEARFARDQFTSLAAPDRARVISFLRSL